MQLNDVKGSVTNLIFEKIPLPQLIVTMQAEDEIVASSEYWMLWSVNCL